MDKILVKYLKTLMKDSLYRNSTYLLLNSALMAVTSFLFWLIGTHLYSASEVGIATNLISLTSVLLLFSYLGLNNSIIRYLPHSANRADLIDSVFWITSLMAIIVSSIFVLEVKHLIPALGFLHSFWLGSLFVVLIVINVQNTITDNIFLAERITKYTFLANCGFSVARLVLPFGLLYIGNSGLFVSHAIGITISTLLSIWFAAKYANYVPRPKIKFELIKKMFKFSATNYISNFMVSATPMLLPLIVTSRLGIKKSAYFYIATSIANLIYIIPNVATNAMFAEGSHDKIAIRNHIKKSLRFILILIIPASLIIILGAGLILNIFGSGYSVEGAATLRIFCSASLFMTINYISATTLQIELKMPAMVVITTLGAAIVIAGAYIFGGRSLNDIAWSWFVGQGVSSLLFISYIIKTIFPIPARKIL